MEQIIYPDLTTEGTTGYCLKFVGDAYKLKPRPYDSAQEAWDGAKFKHNDRLPDVAVPVFFSWYGSVEGVKAWYGDVAIWVPGRGVYGTPIKGDKNKFRWDKTVEDRARVIGGGKYLGWTEDLNGVRLVQGDDMITGQQVDLQFQIAFNRRAAAEEVKYWTGKELTEFLNWTLKNNIYQRTRMSEFDNISRALKESDAEVDKLRKQLANKPDKPVLLPPGTYQFIESK